MIKDIIELAKSEMKTKNIILLVLDVILLGEFLLNFLNKGLSEYEVYDTCKDQSPVDILAYVLEIVPDTGKYLKRDHFLTLKPKIVCDG